MRAVAERRCFSRKVVESDDFLALSDSCQALYFHLNMAADDDGFLNGAKAVAARSPTGIRDLERLVEAGFLLQFGKIYVIKHWKISNTLRSDRMKELAFPDIAGKLFVRTNRAYTLGPKNGEKSLFELKTGVPYRETQEKRTEENRTEDNSTEARRDYAALQLAYPESRRGGDCFGVFCRVIQNHGDFERAMKSLAGWKRSEQWSKEGGRYIPLLGNWLERGFWQACPESKGPSLMLGQAELEAIQNILKEEP